MLRNKGERVFAIPLDVAIKRPIVRSDGSSIFCKTHSLPIEFYPDGSCLVFGLLLFRGPAAIFRRVRTVIVNPLYGMALRGLPHIFKKISEAIKPPTTHGYPSSSVGFPFRIIGICDSAFSMPVRSQSRGCFSVDSVSTTCGSCAIVISNQASAAFKSAVSNMCDVFNNLISAITFPKPRVVFPWLSANSGKSVILVTRYINRLHSHTIRFVATGIVTHRKQEVNHAC